MMTSKLDITVAVDLSSESALVSPQGKLTAADPEAVAMIRDSGWQGSHLLGAGKVARGRAA